MSQITISNLTFYYEGSYDNIFEDVSFQINTDWKLGFVARNGRGKTTFLNLLLGKYEYRGNIKSSLPFDYFPFQISDESKEKNTIDVIDELYSDYELWKICREFTLLQVDAETLYRPFGTLSNGEQTKVLLALLFSKDNNFLLIDEPTNHLDMVAREIVKDYLNQKKGFLLVSHDRCFLDACIDHVLAINKATISVEQGNFSSWWENKKRQDEYELAENERLKKDITKLTESAKKSAAWADKVEATKIGFNPIKEDRFMNSRSYIGEKSKRMQQRRKNLERRQEKAIDEKSHLLKNLETVDDLKIIPLKHHKDTLVTVKDLSICYGENTVINELGFQINNGDRVLLKGNNGCGKSSIIKKIIGQDIPSTGIMELASGLIISYVCQDTSFLKGTLEEFVKEHHIDESLFKGILRKLDFERVQFEKRIEDYSGGQKKKVLIAKSLCEQAHLYIWDEPLNYIDIFSRMQIEQLIIQFKPTMLLVEHDNFFVEHIATKIINYKK